MTIRTSIKPISDKRAPVGVNREAQIIRENLENTMHGIIGMSVCMKHYYDNAVQRKFWEFKTKWKEETMLHSNSNEIIGNENYWKIINLGVDVLPYIFEDLAETHDHWFIALQEITGKNPVKPNNRGNVVAMTRDWLDWANE